MTSDVSKIPEIIKINHKSERKLSLTLITDAVVLPGTNIGGGIISGKHYYEESAMHINHAYAHPYKYKEDDTLLDNVDAIYIGMLDPVWGHCITDNLKNLWVFFDKNLSVNINNLKIIYTTNNSAKKLPNSFIDLLLSIGIDISSFTCINRITKFKRLYLPDSCFYCDKCTNVRYYTQEYIDLIERITKNYSYSSISEYPEKIYFSREHWKSPKDFGEKYVRKAFEKSGYRVIYPESLSLREQISIINKCTSLATTDGSIAHNSLFMQNGRELIIIRKASYLNEYQSAINEFRDLNVVLIDANKSNMLINKKRPWSGPFFIYSNRQLCAFLRIKKANFPLFSYTKYCLISILRRIKINIEKCVQILTKKKCRTFEKT
jgi:hypothetical protein